MGNISPLFSPGDWTPEKIAAGLQTKVLAEGKPGTLTRHGGSVLNHMLELGRPSYVRTV
jgi:hypothetical protein